MTSKRRATGDPLKGADRRAALEALRDLLAESLRDGPEGARAQTAAQYRATLADLAALGSSEVKVSKADELAQRRRQAGRAG